MSIVAVHGPSTWGDSEDQGGSVGLPDNIAMQEQPGTGTGTAYNATTTSDATSAAAVTATATSEAFRPTRVTAY